jgi:hypothetical protein
MVGELLRQQLGEPPSSPMLRRGLFFCSGAAIARRLSVVTFSAPSRLDGSICGFSGAYIRNVPVLQSSRLFSSGEAQTQISELLEMGN